MSFTKRFEEGLAKFNSQVPQEPAVQEVLREYTGRAIVLNLLDDTSYTFHISPEGLSLSTDSKPGTDDMYLETTSTILQKMIDERRVDPLDLLRGKIKWKNISLKEVSIVKKMLNLTNSNDVKP